MSLPERMSEDLKAALRAGQRRRAGVLRMLLSELKVAETSGKQVDELAVVNSYARKLRKAAERYEQLNLPDKAGESLVELAIVEEFLPLQMRPPLRLKSSSFALSRRTTTRPVTLARL